MGFQLWPQAVSPAVELGSLAALSEPSHLSSLAEPAAPAAGTVPIARQPRVPADPLKEALRETEMKNSCNQKCMLSRICAVTP